MAATIPCGRVRIAADAASSETMIDALTGGSPQIWRGSDTQFEIGVFWHGEIASDISNIESLVMQVKDLTNLSGDALVSVTVAAVNLVQSVSLVNWQNGTAQHAVVSFSNANTNFDLAGATSKGFWLVIGVVTTDSPDKVFTLAAGSLTVYESGFAGSTTPVTMAAPGARMKNGKLQVLCATDGLYYDMVVRLINGVPTPSLEGDGEV